MALSSSGFLGRPAARAAAAVMAHPFREPTPMRYYIPVSIRNVTLSWKDGHHDDCPAARDGRGAGLPRQLRSGPVRGGPRDDDRDGPLPDPGDHETARPDQLLRRGR